MTLHYFLIATKYCRSDGGTGSLTESSLKNILETGLGKDDRFFNKKHGTQDTFLTVDFGRKVFRQENADKHAEDLSLDKKKNYADLIDRNGIWLNNSPCPRCAKLIMRTYH
jgi:hypothetical protein